MIQYNFLVQTVNDHLFMKLKFYYLNNVILYSTFFAYCITLAWSNYKIMANIIPFRGVFYNPSKINNLADVIAPPFDVISKEEQEQFHKCHPQNIIRLTLGRANKNDSNDNNPYTRAAGHLEKWRSDKTLVRDETEGLYLTSHEFPFENKSVIRYGLIALVGLEPFEKGIVLPHEKTFSKIRSQRLELMKACKTNLSAIFSLYSDIENQIHNRLKGEASNKTPDIRFTDNKGHKHCLWRITDKNIQLNITEPFRDKPIFIADGHHSYETALNYRDWLSTNNSNFDDSHPANYVMMYLCSMQDPGLIVLPAHRMLNEVSYSARMSLISRAAEYFDITTFPFKTIDHNKDRDEFMSALKANTSKNCIGIFMKDCPELYLLILKQGVMEKMFGDELPESLRNIDVTVLTRLIFMELLGFDQARLDNEKLIAYASVAEEAIAAIDAGKHDIAFILNPTKIEQVRSIAENGLIMPRKATYFFPKVITGQVMNPLS